MSKQNPLIGRMLLSVHLAEDNKAIKFVTDGGEVVARCDGDCCSDTWIDHVEMPTKLPACVLSVQDVELNTGVDDRDGELQFYGCKITTEGGDLIIDYRNESNGYYGGDLVWPGETFYGGVYNQNVSNEQWDDAL